MANDQPIDGIVLLDKPTGLSSNQALQRVRRVYRAQKAGHTGTLDPLASGLLPICLGEATKFGQAGLNADKRYCADIVLGATSSSGDAEGEITVHSQVAPSDIDEQTLRRTLDGFVGEQLQLPPLYSALKHQGRPLYEFARRGQEVPRQPRAITIYRLELLARPASHRLSIDVTVSKGTYIRVLAEDIGRQLGCGAYLGALRRTAIGEVDLSAAVTLADLDDGETRQRALAPLDLFIRHLPPVWLLADAAARFSHGQPVEATVNPLTTTCRCYHAERLLGLGEWRGEPPLLWPKRLLASVD